MSALIVTTQAVVDVLESNGYAINTLLDYDALTKALSAHDLAEMQLANEEFPFDFSQDLDIQIAIDPLSWLQLSELHVNMYERVKGRVETTQLQKADKDLSIPVYRFVAIDGQRWVAVMQRHPGNGSDPNQLLLSLNLDFFNDMIAQILHTHSFETMCKSNVFTYFLKAYTPQCDAA